MNTTLVLTRSPLKTFNHGVQSGRWGELLALKGPKVTAARLSPRDTPTGPAGIPIGNGTLALTISEGEIGEVKRFTSMERFHADSGKGYYVQLHPQAKPYTITFEPGNSAVKQLRHGHDGRCFRVNGGRAGPEQGILIHEAPHVGWLIGCISPRPLNNFGIDFANDDGNPSFNAMNELIQFVGGQPADFFVLDW